EISRELLSQMPETCQIAICREYPVYLRGPRWRWDPLLTRVAETYPYRACQTGAAAAVSPFPCHCRGDWIEWRHELAVFLFPQAVRLLPGRQIPGADGGPEQPYLPREP